MLTSSAPKTEAVLRAGNVAVILSVSTNAVVTAKAKPTGAMIFCSVGFAVEEYAKLALKIALKMEIPESFTFLQISSSAINERTFLAKLAVTANFALTTNEAGSWLALKPRWSCSHNCLTVYGHC